jgi:dihydrofolate synthase/folylpolyglutamate synthase
MQHPDPHIATLLGDLASPRLATIDLSLDRMVALMQALGNPQAHLPPVIHVAGTNGKGSLLAYLRAICEAAGLRVHRYTSPHLVQFNERILLAGRDIDDAHLRVLLERLLPVMESHPVTFFEATTALAYMAFRDLPADILLLETGLGGRLDATNILPAPALCAITPVSIDHAEYLGNTIALIAGEKAGIIKEGVPCVVGPQRDEAFAVIEAEAQRKSAPLYRYGSEWDVAAGRYHSATRDMRMPLPALPGAHQIANAATAIACIDCLPQFAITEDHIAQGIRAASWPARLQRLTTGSLAALLPKGAELWLDGGHNPAAGSVLAEWARGQSKPIHLICGMLKNKDAGEFLAPLAPFVRSFTAVAIEGEPLGRQPEQLAQIASEKISKISLSNNIKNAIQNIVLKEKKEYSILICGSLYLAGNILWQNSQEV